MKKSKAKPPAPKADAPVVRVNWSTLRYLAVSAKLLKWRAEHPEESTPAKRLGSAIHCAILEPAIFPSRWITAGKCSAIKRDGAECDLQGSLTAAAFFREGRTTSLVNRWFCKTKSHAPPEAAPPVGAEILTLEDKNVLDLVVAAVREHKVAARVLTGGLAEHEVHWTHEETGLACRGRLDYLKPTELVDLKSTREGTVGGFSREVAARLYYAQVAWYHDGAIAAKKLQPDAALPIIVAASTSEPYDVAVFRLTKVAYQAGQILYRDFLLKYKDCMTAGYWPGIAPGLLDLDLPKWAPGMDGTDYERSEW